MSRFPILRDLALWTWGGDNGRGFDAWVWRASQTNGHGRLRSMQERAEKIGAPFSFTRSVGKGTDVRVIVPARRVYVRTNGFWLFSPKHFST